MQQDDRRLSLAQDLVVYLDPIPIEEIAIRTSQLLRGKGVLEWGDGQYQWDHRQEQQENGQDEREDTQNAQKPFTDHSLVLRALQVFYINPVIFIGLTAQVNQITPHLNRRLSYLGKLSFGESVICESLFHLCVHERISTAALEFGQNACAIER